MFDIAHAKALDNCKFDEDKEFLIAQRQADRTGSIGGMDRKTFQKEKRRTEWLEKEENRKNCTLNCLFNWLMNDVRFALNQILLKLDFH